MKVEVHLKEQSQPVVIEDVRNTYQKGDLFCVMLNSRLVRKFPLADIFQITEHPATAGVPK